MSEEAPKTTPTVVNHIDIWPDWISIALGFCIIVGIFFFTGLELSFERNGNAGIYMEFTKIE